MAAIGVGRARCRRRGAGHLALTADDTADRGDGGLERVACVDVGGVVGIGFARTDEAEPCDVARYAERPVVAVHESPLADVEAERDVEGARAVARGDPEVACRVVVDAGDARQRHAVGSASGNRARQPFVDAVRVPWTASRHELAAAARVAAVARKEVAVVAFLAGIEHTVPAGRRRRRRGN